MNQERRFFGTDGIRGRVGEYPITADFVLKVGWAIGHVLVKKFGKLSTVLIGKDTRLSGYMFESALEAGITSAGAHTALLGPMPTSAIAYLTRTLRAQIGIVISASHNPYDNNGIKLFTSDGYKLSSEWELEIETCLAKAMKTANPKFLGKASRIYDAPGRYIEFCKSSIPHNTSLKNFKLVVDCANGATYHVAPPIFHELGAHVITIHDSPNGLNINENCGSNHPEVVKRHVLKHKADVGIAFDGDGDRVIMIDHLGEILDGDELLYIITQGHLQTKSLTGGVVGTFMSNKGLEMALQKLNIPFVRVPVGEQNVIEALIKNNWLVGGEPSGHIIDRRVTTTDDGIITALQVLQCMFLTGKNLHELKQGITKLPQKLINVVHNSQQFDLNQPSIVQAVKEAETTLGDKGRVLIRKSGTEPVIRIMVEGENSSTVDILANSIMMTINKLLNNLPLNAQQNLV